LKYISEKKISGRKICNFFRFFGARLKNNKGLTYIEVLIAGTVVSIFLVHIALTLYQIRLSNTMAFDMYNREVLATNLITKVANTLYAIEDPIEALAEADSIGQFLSIEEEFEEIYEDFMFLLEISAGDYEFVFSKRDHEDAYLEEYDWWAQGDDWRIPADDAISMPLTKSVNSNQTIDLSHITEGKIDVELTNASDGFITVKFYVYQNMPPENIDINVLSENIFVSVVPKIEMMVLQLRLIVIDENDEHMFLLERNITVS